MCFLSNVYHGAYYIIRDESRLTEAKVQKGDRCDARILKTSSLLARANVR